MKKFRLVPLLACAGVSTALGFGSIFAPSALAQTDTTAATTTDAPTKKGEGKGKGKGKGTGKKGDMGVPARVLAAIEAKSGKPLTDEQKTQLNAAQKTRMDAVAAARDSYLSAAATITGLNVADLGDIEKGGKKGGKADLGDIEKGGKKDGKKAPKTGDAPAATP